MIQTSVRCQKSEHLTLCKRPWFIFLADAQGHPGAGLRRGPGAAAGAGAGLHYRHGPSRYTAPLSGPGE